MTHINIRSIDCGLCGLPNGEAATSDICRHCRVSPREKDAGSVRRVNLTYARTPAAAVEGESQFASTANIKG